MAPAGGTAARTALRRAADQLAAAGNVSPRVDAELLLAHLSGVDRGKLVLLGDLSEDSQRRFEALVLARAAGTPLQHLTGSAPFRHIELAVGPGVFIPRPETELIVELAAARLAQARLVLDLCAGSGAIALAVANEFPATSVLAVERSAEAIEWLRSNAATRARAGDPPIAIEEADVADIGPTGRLSDFAAIADVVLANPPYVPERHRALLPTEVAADPAAAVFAGADGLAVMPALSRAAAWLLRPDGLLVIEHDDSQAQSLPELLTATGDWSGVRDHPDLAGRSRFVTATRAR